MRVSALLFASLVAGCPAAGDDDDSAGPSPRVIYTFPEGDAADAEPNDTAEMAQDLGTLSGPFALTGSSSSCGEDGTWDPSDHDWFSFSPATGDPLRLRLDMWAGDVDLAVLDAEGALIVDGAQAGLDDEEVDVALDPEEPWLLRIRCWQGNPGTLWRLRLL